MLPFDLILAANRLSGQAIGQIDQRADVAERRNFLGARLKMDGKGMLEEFKAGALCPATVGIRTAEGLGHRVVEATTLNGLVGAQTG